MSKPYTVHETDLNLNLFIFKVLYMMSFALELWWIVEAEGNYVLFVDCSIQYMYKEQGHLFSPFGKTF